MITFQKLYINLYITNRIQRRVILELIKISDAIQLLCYCCHFLLLMLLTLKLKGRRKEWKIGTDKKGQSRQNTIDHSLRQVFNLTFTDYCSIRTKKKLDTVQIKPYQENEGKESLFSNKISHRGRKNPWLTVQPESVVFQKKGFTQRLKTEQVSFKGTVRDSKMSRDWLSRKLKEIQAIEPDHQWLTTSGKKMRIVKNQNQYFNLLNRYPSRVKTQHSKRFRSQNNSIMQQQRRHKSIYSQTSNHRPATTTQFDIKGWQINLNDEY